MLDFFIKKYCKYIKVRCIINDYVEVKENDMKNNAFSQKKLCEMVKMKNWMLKKFNQCTYS